MVESSGTSPHSSDFSEETALQNQKKWKNRFLISLTVSIFLVGIFWLPLKAIQVNDFMDSPSVNLPKTGEVAEKEEEKPQPITVRLPKNTIMPKYVTVNASSETKWVYFNLSQGKTLDIKDPTSLEWDLAFRRGKVITNGGATNKFGQGAVLNMGEMSFLDVLKVPRDQYVADSRNKTESENEELNSWYKYNFLTHKLTARENVYALKSAKGKFAKIQFLSFYCKNGETGCIKLRYTYQSNGTSGFVNAS
jgi:hypothetical protein